MILFTRNTLVPVRDGFNTNTKKKNFTPTVTFPPERHANIPVMTTVLPPTVKPTPTTSGPSTSPTPVMTLELPTAYPNLLPSPPLTTPHAVMQVSASLRTLMQPHSPKKPRQQFKRKMQKKRKNIRHATIKVPLHVENPHSLKQPSVPKKAHQQLKRKIKKSCRSKAVLSSNRHVTMRVLLPVTKSHFPIQAFVNKKNQQKFKLDMKKKRKNSVFRIRLNLMNYGLLLLIMVFLFMDTNASTEEFIKKEETKVELSQSDESNEKKGLSILPKPEILKRNKKNNKKFKLNDTVKVKNASDDLLTFYGTILEIDYDDHPLKVQSLPDCKKIQTFAKADWENKGFEIVYIPFQKEDIIYALNSFKTMNYKLVVKGDALEIYGIQGDQGWLLVNKVKDPWVKYQWISDKNFEDITKQPVKESKFLKLKMLVNTVLGFLERYATFKSSMVTTFIFRIILCTIFAYIGPVFLWEKSIVPLVLILTAMVIGSLTQYLAIRFTRENKNYFKLISHQLKLKQLFLHNEISSFWVLSFPSIKLGYRSLITLLIIATYIQFPPIDHPDFQNKIISNVISNIFNGIGCLGLLLVTSVPLEIKHKYPKKGLVLQLLTWVSKKTGCNYLIQWYTEFFKYKCFKRLGPSNNVHIAGSSLAFGMFITDQLCLSSANLMNLYVHDIFPSGLWNQIIAWVLVILQIFTNIVSTRAALKWNFTGKAIHEWIIAISIALFYVEKGILTAMFPLVPGEGEWP